MIKRRAVGLAAATVVLGGLGAYGAVTAFADSPAVSAPPATTTLSVTAGDLDAMIRHCTDQLPAGERAEARQQMEQMMSGSMMSGSSRGAHHGMD
ncbi:hypothetical protein [Streptomyces sp. H27-S2]|uniref:hypothetical protein n=1 Tax=Streptomyces antarcticus TaxID=2996458 RepID=UPI002271584A|nr:hypothetical protein [Streptomyces sp. H27-S2]MCY0955155.1 hypothetical protein [Streptomyces sp. H27-S2]